VTPSGLVGTYRRFGRNLCVHRRGITELSATYRHTITTPPPSPRPHSSYYAASRLHASELEVTRLSGDHAVLFAVPTTGIFVQHLSLVGTSSVVGRVRRCKCWPLVPFPPTVVKGDTSQSCHQYLFTDKAQDGWLHSHGSSLLCKQTSEMCVCVCLCVCVVCVLVCVVCVVCVCACVCVVCVCGVCLCVVCACVCVVCV
jgi:hypothetical protein